MDINITVGCVKCTDSMTCSSEPPQLYTCGVCGAEVTVVVKVIHRQVVDYTKENAAGQKFYLIPGDE